MSAGRGADHGPPRIDQSTVLSSLQIRINQDPDLNGSSIYSTSASSSSESASIQTPTLPLLPTDSFLESQVEVTLEQAPFAMISGQNPPMESCSMTRPAPPQSTTTHTDIPGYTLPSVSQSSDSLNSDTSGSGSVSGSLDAQGRAQVRIRRMRRTWRESIKEQLDNDSISGLNEEDAKTKCKRLQAKVRELQQQLLECHTDVTRLENSNVSSKQNMSLQLSSTTRERSLHVWEALRLVEEEKTRMKSALETLSVANEKLKKSMEELTVEKLRAENKALSKEQQFRKAKRELDKSRGSSGDEYDHLPDPEKLLQTISMLKAELHLLRDEKVRLGQELEGKNQEVESLCKSLELHMDCVNSAVGSNVRWRQAASSEEKNSLLTELSNHVSFKVEELKAEVKEEREKSADKLQAEIAKLKEENVSLHQWYKQEYQSTIVQHQEKADMLSNNLATASTVLEEKKQQISKLKAEIEVLKANPGATVGSEGNSGQPSPAAQEAETKYYQDFNQFFIVMKEGRQAVIDKENLMVKMAHKEIEFVSRETEPTEEEMAVLDRAQGEVDEFNNIIRAKEERCVHLLQQMKEHFLTVATSKTSLAPGASNSKLATQESHQKTYGHTKQSTDQTDGPITSFYSLLSGVTQLSVDVTEDAIDNAVQVLTAGTYTPVPVKNMLRSEFHRFINVIVEQNRVVKEKEQQVKYCQRAISELETDISNLKSEGSRSAEILKESSTSLHQELSDTLKRLKEENVSLSQQVIDAKKGLEEGKLTLGAMDKENARLLQELAHISKRLEEAHVKFSQDHAETTKRLETEKAQLQNDLFEAKWKLVENTGVCQNTEHAVMETETIRLKQEVAEVQTKLDENEKHSQELTLNNNSLREENEGLQLKLTEMTSKLEVEQAQLTDLTETNKRLEEQSMQLCRNTSHETLEEENKKLRIKLIETENEFKSVKAFQEMSKYENRELEQKLTDIIKELEEERTQICRDPTHATLVENENRHRKDHMAAISLLEGENAMLRQEITNTNQKLEEEKVARVCHDPTHAALVVETSHQQQQVFDETTRWEEEKTKFQTEIADLNRNFEEERTRLLREIADITKQLDDEKTKLCRVSSHVTLEEENRKLQAQLATSSHSSSVDSTSTQQEVSEQTSFGQVQTSDLQTTHTSDGTQLVNECLDLIMGGQNTTVTRERLILEFTNLRQTNITLSEQIISLQGEVTSLRGDLETEKTAELERSIALLRDEAHHEAQHAATLEDRLQKVMTNLSEAEASHAAVVDQMIKDHNTAVSTLTIHHQEELTSLRENLCKPGTSATVTTTTTSCDVQQEVMRLREELKSKEQTIVCYQEQVRQHAFTIVAIEERLNTLVVKNREYREEVEKYKIELNEKNITLSELTSQEKLDISSSIIHTHPKTSQQGGSCPSQPNQQCLVRLRRENANLKNQNIQAHKIIEGLRRDMSGLAARLSDVAGEVDDSTKQQYDENYTRLVDADRELTHHKQKVKGLFKIVDEKVAEIKRFTTEQKKLKEVAVKLKKSLEDKESVIQGLEDKLDKVRQDVQKEKDKFETEREAVKELVTLGTSCRGERHEHVISNQRQGLNELRSQIKTYELYPKPGPSHDDALQQVILLKKELAEVRAQEALRETVGLVLNTQSTTTSTQNVASIQDVFESTAAHVNVETLELSETSYTNFIKAVSEALDIDELKSERRMSHIPADEQLRLFREREQALAIAVNRIKLLRERLSRKEELLAGYEEDLAKLRCAEKLLTVKETQIEELSKEIRQRTEENECLRHTLDKSRQGELQRSYVTKVANKKVSSGKKEKSEAMKKKDYEIKVLKTELGKREQQVELYRKQLTVANDKEGQKVFQTPSPPMSRPTSAKTARRPRTLVVKRPASAKTLTEHEVSLTSSSSSTTTTTTVSTEMVREEGAQAELRTVLDHTDLAYSVMTGEQEEGERARVTFTGIDVKDDSTSSGF